MKPFEIIRHATDGEGRKIVDVCGIYFSNADSIKLRDELNRLIPSPEHAALVAVAEAAGMCETGNSNPVLESALDHLAAVRATQ